MNGFNGGYGSRHPRHFNRTPAFDSPQDAEAYIKFNHYINARAGKYGETERVKALRIKYNSSN